jgi:uncharacterized protein YxeA
MRIIQGIVMAIGVIAILAFVTIAIGYFLYTLTPGIQARMIPVAVTAEAAESFDQKLDDLETEIKKTAEDGDKQDITVTITENEINSKLLELLAEGKGVSAKTGAIGRIELTEGSPKIVIEDFDLGKLPLSNRFNKRVEDLTNVLVKLQLADWPLDMTKISITDRQLTFSAKWKTAQ